MTDTSDVEVYQITKDGKVLFTGTHNECFIQLLHIQSCSTDHAMKYEGYKIVPVTQEQGEI
jgi:hypothetical protein